MKKINFAVIFGAEQNYFYDTLISLYVDAQRYLSSIGMDSQSFLKRSEKEVNILGIDFRWLRKKDSYQRALLVTPDLKIKNIDFGKPLSLDAIWILHLPTEGEKLLHQKLSSFFEETSVFQINPYLASKRVDDKFYTYKLWSFSNLPLPSTILISKGTSYREIKAKVLRFLKKLRKKRETILYLQPNKGTEGKNTFRIKFNGASFDNAEKEMKEKISPLIDNLLKEDDVICREERGNLFYFKKDERGKGLRRFVLRVNVGYNGKNFTSESGFAQVAKDDKSFITSFEKGGEIKGINEVLSNLYFLEDGKSSRFIPSHFDIERMKKVAELAAFSLNKGLKKRESLSFVGLDLLLEVGEKRNLVVVPLEANPRPAGLNKAEEIQGVSHKSPPPKITTVLFELILRCGNL